MRVGRPSTSTRSRHSRSPATSTRCRRRSPPRFAEVAGFRASRASCSGVDGAGRPFVVAGLGARHALDARACAAPRPSSAARSNTRRRSRSSPVRSCSTRSAPRLRPRAIAEGVALGVHRFAGHKSQPEPLALARCEIVVTDPAADRGVALGAIVAGAVGFARDLADETPARLGALRLAEIAIEVAAAHDLAVTIWDEHDIDASASAASPP